MLSLPKPLDEIQPNLVCELLTFMERVSANFFFGLAPWGSGVRGQKVKYHLISITKSNSKIFIPNFVCVLTNERYRNLSDRIFILRLGHALGVGFWGAGGPGVNFFFFKHDHVAHQIEGDDEQNRMQVKVSS